MRCVCVCVGVVFRAKTKIEQRYHWVLVNSDSESVKCCNFDKTNPSHFVAASSARLTKLDETFGEMKEITIKTIAVNVNKNK